MVQLDLIINKNTLIKYSNNVPILFWKKDSSSHVVVLIISLQSYIVSYLM